MTKKVKVVCYVVLSVLGIWCGIGFVGAYTSAPPRPQETEGSTEAPAPKSFGRSGMMGYGAGLLVVIVLTALLAAYDISGAVAQKVEEFVYDERGEGDRDPEYEEAERIWANGQHLEAIRLMREYLKLHPLEQYVALRIAEIYEKDLHNHLAAALEYEEVLKKRLQPERWGWAAIHLANLYSGKLNRPDDAAALLRRIINEHPRTGAAKKARERLGEPEPPPAPLQPAAPAAEASNLPPGFRPK